MDNDALLNKKRESATDEAAEIEGQDKRLCA